MKNKNLAIFGLMMLASATQAQHISVGDTKVSAQQFIKDHAYGLEKIGADKTIQNYVDFTLLQKMAIKKGSDTTQMFVKKTAEVENGIRQKNFMSADLLKKYTQKFAKDSQTEVKYFIFFKKLEAGDKTDYNKVYKEVTSGKMTMAQATEQYKSDVKEAQYIKAGVMDEEIESDLMHAPKNTFSKYISDGKFVLFAQKIDQRPSLGFMIFGSISYPNDEKAAEQKAAIYKALDEKKNFKKVAEEFGSTPQEKESANASRNSPILPDAVYEAFKTIKKGEFTQPILLNDKYHVFYMFDQLAIDEKAENQQFYSQAIARTSYQHRLMNEYAAQLKAKGFATTPDYKKALQLAQFKLMKPNTVLYTYQDFKQTVEGINKSLTEQKAKLEDFSPATWAKFLEKNQNGDVLKTYNQNMVKLPAYQEEVQSAQRNVRAEYVYSNVIKQAVRDDQEAMKKYYEDNKATKYKKDDFFKIRLIAAKNESDLAEIKKDLNKNLNKANWEALKTQYKDQKDDKKQDKVSFEEGNVEENSTFFSRNQLKNTVGIQEGKLGEKSIILSIDELLKNQILTFDEAKQRLEDDLADIKLDQFLDEEKKHTKITIEPEFKNVVNQAAEAAKKAAEAAQKTAENNPAQKSN
jgi:hypothetical protein